jgi:hypothetical protein
MEITDLPFIFIVMPEWFYRASSKKSWIPAQQHCGNDGALRLDNRYI